MTEPPEPDDEPSVGPEDLEPEEFDPDSLGPDVPSVPNLSDQVEDVDPEVSGLFWYLVLVFNVSLLAISLGLMFVSFQRNWVIGGQLLIAGVVLGGYGYVRYRRFREG